MLDLQSKAKEMVMLAEKMRQKLLSSSNSQTNATNDEEMGSKEEIQDWLLSVGIISPVTKESAGALYHQQLSRQVFYLCSAIIRYFLSNEKIMQIVRNIFNKYFIIIIFSLPLTLKKVDFYIKNSQLRI